MKKIGDKVKVINTGLAYPLYDTLAKHFKLKRWEKNFLPKINDVGIVIGIEDEGHRVIYAVKGNRRDFLIGGEGIEKINSKITYEYG